jgi:hypothetical protein
VTRRFYWIENPGIEKKVDNSRKSRKKNSTTNWSAMRLSEEKRMLLSIAFVQEGKREREKEKYWKYKYLLFYTDILIAIFLFHQPASTNLLSVRRRERLTESFAHAFLSIVWLPLLDWWNGKTRCVFHDSGNNKLGTKETCRQR